MTVGLQVLKVDITFELSIPTETPYQANQLFRLAQSPKKTFPFCAHGTPNSNSCCEPFRRTPFNNRLALKREFPPLNRPVWLHASMLILIV